MNTCNTPTLSNVIKSPFPDIDIPNSDVFTFLKTRFLKHPKDILLTFASTGETFTAKRIINLAENVAIALSQRGLGKGDGVTVIASNCVEYIITCLATLALGAVFAPVYTSLDDVELRRQAEAVRAKVIACTSNFLNTARKVYHGSDLVKIFVVFDEVEVKSDTTSFADFAVNNGSFDQPPEINVAIETAIVLNSSGSTGSPKGILRTHRNIVANLSQLMHQAFMELEPGESAMVQAPLAHAGGLFAAFQYMLQRANAVIIADFNISRDLSYIKRYEIKFMFLPSWHATSIAKGNILPCPDLTSLRAVNTGGSFLSVEAEEMFSHRAGGAEVHQAYGCTEGGAITLVPKQEKLRHSGSVGIPLPNVKIKIVDPSTGSDLPPTNLGEICIQSPGMMKGYLNAPAATASAIDENGWFHSGDIGYFSEDGHLFITDRIKELIFYKDGQHVAPSVIEGVLLSHPAVAECVIVGILIGEVVEPKAFVVLQPDADPSRVTAEDLQDFVAGRTTVLNRLRGGVRFLKEIPKSPSTKPLRNELRKL